MHETGGVKEMAKQIEDTVTAELPLVKRGRPATGKAMTPAERKRAQRERQKKVVWGSEEVLKKAPITSLLAEIPNLMRAGPVLHERLKKVLAEIERRSAKT